MFTREIIITVIVILTFLLLLLTTPINAHQAPSGWQYDVFCCHDKDCSIVEKMEQDPNTSGLNIKTIVTTKHGTGIVTPQTQWLKSQDDKDHACILNGKVICFYGALKF